MGAPFAIEHTVGATAEFHALTSFTGRIALFHQVQQPTLVLGSTQRPNEVDGHVAAALGVDVVGRRSGGGSVLVMPGEAVWLDLVIPAGDPLWCDDVGAAMKWVGECWRAALDAIGMSTSVHEGGLLSGAWGRSICFASVGTGEVMQGTAKVVGISQRRTREWARFQTMCHLRWRPELVAALTAAPRPAAADLAAVVAVVPEPAAALTAALSAQLRQY
jgi:lipoate-protein ligase A